MLRYSRQCILLTLLASVAFLLFIGLHNSSEKISNFPSFHYPEFAFVKIPQIVIYNRIPKTGSTSVIHCFEVLKSQKHFLIIRVNVTNLLQFYSIKMHQLLVENLSSNSENTPIFLHGHFTYINFERFGSTLSPLYINVLREPLERFVSKYYFIRFGDNHRPRTQRSRMINNTERWQTFDECVASRGRDCRPSLLWIQVPFFCGSAWFCNIPGNKLALNTAKRHLVEHYLLVGVTENLKEFMFMLKFLLPRFLGDSNRPLSATDQHLLHLRRTNRKMPVLESTYGVFKSDPIWMAEKDFYEFAKSEFHSRYKSFLKSQVRRELPSNLILSN